MSPATARPFCAVSLVVVLLVPIANTAGAAPSEPGLRLVSPGREVTLNRYQRGDPVVMDLGLLVAAVDGPFELRAQRSDYASSPTLTQVLHGPGDETEVRTLDPGLLDGWNGLRDFFEVTFEDDDGSLVLDTTLTFCPNDPDRQRFNDGGPDTPTYPPGCFANPFTKGVVWGIDQGWTTRVASSTSPLVAIANGRYEVHVAIGESYREIFGIAAEHASVDLDVIVKRMRFDGCGSHGCEGHVREAAAGPDEREEGRVSLTAAPTLDDPDPAILPDLIALPSWGIRVENRRTRSRLSFGATVWVAGASDLVVEGFRRAGEATMDAYQYFYSDGEVIGRAPAGELEFDPRRGHEHWHFEQFARYSLVDGVGAEVMASRKESFCLAATDAIDTTLPGARWTPYVGLSSACGSVTSIWTRETLPLGWGDTYFQNLPGQSFNITDVPNGTYYIRIDANPTGLLHEQTATNNTEIREVILSGPPGKRRVEVPPWNGIDSETSSGFSVLQADQPANGRIAFIRNVNGTTDVASMGPSGGGSTRLTRSDAAELYVDVSPNGRVAAFTRFGRNGGEIYTVPVKGGIPTRLTRDRVHDELPIWSPDSSRIAFVRYSGGDDPEIFVMDADGSNRIRVTDNDASDADPRWSPDGMQLIYNGGNVDENTQDVFLVTLGRPDVTTLTSPGVNDSFAEFAPDGGSIVYSSLRDDQWDIYSVGIDGAVTTQLTDHASDDYAPEFSWDGNRLLFVRGRLEGNLPADEVFVMGVDGSDQMSVSPPRLQAFSPDWAPDGKRIVFVGQVRSGSLPRWELFTVGRDGTDLTRVTRTGSEEFDPEWARRP